MAEKIPYWKFNSFFGTWSLKTGSKGCEVCTDKSARMSLDRAPPSLLNESMAMAVVNETPKEKIVHKKEDERPYLDFPAAFFATVDAVNRFKKWVDSPNPAPVEETIQKDFPKKTIPNFDIQDMPGAMRHLGMPKAAEMFEKWFSGKLNYSPTDRNSYDEIGQDGYGYADEAYDLTSIKFKWILSFARAERALKELTTEKITSDLALDAMRKILRLYRNKGDLSARKECGDNMRELHRRFQFQYTEVEGSLPQKLIQYYVQGITNRGVPDELTLILGSFNIYAAIENAYFLEYPGKTKAFVTHISVYAKDGFTFTDARKRVSQYLGHWSATGVAIIGVAEIEALANMDVWNFPVDVDLSPDYGILFPVKNSDFRDWQLKHNHGGDYMIYSDRKIIRLKRSIMLPL
jgi:hypothetical protein